LRSFKSICGMSPIEYLNNYRCKKAIEQLDSFNCSKTEIAHNCGFYDLSHMERMLKKYRWTIIWKSNINLLVLQIIVSRFEICDVGDDAFGVPLDFTEFAGGRGRPPLQNANKEKCIYESNRWRRERSQCEMQRA